MELTMRNNPVEADLLSRWVQTGSRMLCYYRGHIGRDLPFTEDHNFRVTLSYINKEIVRHYLSGWFELAQTRNGFSDYSYYIIRREHHDTMPRLWVTEHHDDRPISNSMLRKRKVA